MSDAEEVRRFVTQDFCPRHDVSVELLKERLRLYEASIAAIQGVNYVNLRLVIRTLIEMLATPAELAAMDRWYVDARGDGWNFETYEPDEVPTMVRIEQRMRETKNAFKDFFVQVLKGPTFYTDAFNGMRPKASSVGDWMFDDEELMTEEPASYDARIEQFRLAYIAQTQERTDAELKLAEMIENTMEAQDRWHFCICLKFRTNVQEIFFSNSICGIIIIQENTISVHVRDGTQENTTTTTPPFHKRLYRQILHLHYIPNGKPDLPSAIFENMPAKSGSAPKRSAFSLLLLVLPALFAL